jgi:hypothetical protein
MKNRFFLILLLIFSIGCTPKKTSNRFVYKYEQDSQFDTNDFGKMMHYKGNVINENQLNDSICWNQMTLIDSTFLKKSKMNVYLYKFLSNKFGDNVCFITKQKEKLIGYSFKEADLSIYYVNKNTELKFVILELINSIFFILNQSEKPLPEREGQQR